MNSIPSRMQWKIGLMLVPALIPSLPAGAEVVFDGSIGPSGGSLGGPDFVIPRSRGELAGGNLFHSFSKFNLAAGESATFTGPSTVHNILARVTGGPSVINGAIRSDIGGANLFFINPAGMVFGEGASVEVSGAFHATSADFIRFKDGRTFASSVGGDVTLLSAAPEAFGFLAGGGGGGAIRLKGPRSGPAISAPGAIEAEGRGLHFVGRDVEIENYYLKSAGGEIGIVAVGSGAAEVRIDPSTGRLADEPAIGGKVSLSSAAVSVSGANGGGIVIRGGDVTIDGSLDAFSGGPFSGIDARGTGGKNGGEIVIAASSDITLLNAALITAGTTSSGSGGEISIAAGSDVSLLGGAFVTAGTKSSGNGGAIRVNSKNLTMDGGEDGIATQIRCEAGRDASGGGGDIFVNLTGHLALFNGGAIVSQTVGAGHGGDIDIRASSVEAKRNNGKAITGVAALTTRLADSTRSSGFGGGGNIAVHLDGVLKLSNNASIQSTSESDANAGNVAVSAETIRINGAGNNIETDGNQFLTGILALTTLKGFEEGKTLVGGRGGDIVVTASGRILIEAGGQIDASSLGTGTGGSVSVNAGSITADRRGSLFFTGIGSDTEAYDDRMLGNPFWGGPGGNAGNVQVTSLGTIRLLGGANISSSTSGSGNAGHITVNTGGLFISGRGHTSPEYTPGPESGIVALTEPAFGNNPASSGNGGDVTVVINGGRALLKDGGKISAESAGTGTAGRVHVTSVGGLRLLDGGNISSSTASSGDAGNVRVDVGGLFISGRDGDSAVGQKSGIFALTEASSAGNGGRIKVIIAPDGDLFLTNGGRISAESGGTGNGGMVRILASGSDLSVRNGARISARSEQTGNSGLVRIESASLGVHSGGSIESLNTGSGRAGGVDIVAGRILIEDASVSVRAADNNSGRMSLRSMTDLFVNRSRLTASAGANGGRIDLRAGNLMLTDQSRVVATAGRNGGNLNVEATPYLLADHSKFKANATQDGNGGRIEISTDVFLQNLFDFNVSSRFGTSGEVRIDTVNSLTGSEGEKDIAPLDVTDQLQPECTQRLTSRTGSFIKAGRGGSPRLPGGYLPSVRLFSAGGR
ncbi:MAG: filamentous hemagglutinin N-terminal domain-containing protein [Luteolibacter sp.]